jgi:DMATS type aromatic prenyltransferase
VADDHTPLEFSVALDNTIPPALRLLGETIGDKPSAVNNARAFERVLRSAARDFDISTERYDQVRDLFLPEDSSAEFLLWYSTVFRAGHLPALKVYFNPAAHGEENAGELVAEALSRLGLNDAYRDLREHALLRGEADRCVFFAVDLHDRPHARVKVYVAHANARSGDAIRAAAAVSGIDPGQLAEFCAIAGGTDAFAGRPLVSSYTYVSPDTHRPSGYSLYLPIRDYVSDDEEARQRVLQLLAWAGFDPVLLDRAIDALTDRPLAEGVGLIAHVSLRLGIPRPGMTVYLSSEAYAVSRPRRLSPVQ